MFADHRFVLETGRAHGYFEGLDLVGVGDEAAVVVGQHGHRFALQGGVKHAFAGHIKVVAIHQRKYVRVSQSDLIHLISPNAKISTGLELSIC